MKHAVIYVPGLGDHRGSSQGTVVKLWQLYRLRTEVLAMNWRDGEPFSAKLEQLLLRIDELAGAGYQVSLVGISAGASVVINAFAARQEAVHRVVCICGKLQHPDTISASTYRLNPAFKESMANLPNSLLALDSEKRSQILSIRPLVDESVPPGDTVVPGAQAKTIPTISHVVSIAAAITLYSGSIIRFIRKD